MLCWSRKGGDAVSGRACCSPGSLMTLRLGSICWRVGLVFGLGCVYSGSSSSSEGWGTDVWELQRRCLAAAVNIQPKWEGRGDNGAGAGVGGTDSFGAVLFSTVAGCMSFHFSSSQLSFGFLLHSYTSPERNLRKPVPCPTWPPGIAGTQGAPPASARPEAL